MNMMHGLIHYIYIVLGTAVAVGIALDETIAAELGEVVGEIGVSILDVGLAIDGVELSESVYGELSLCITTCRTTHGCLIVILMNQQRSITCYSLFQQYL